MSRERVRRKKPQKSRNNKVKGTADAVPLISFSKNLFFEKLSEVTKADKTNNSRPSAYRWYGRGRVVQ